MNVVELQLRQQLKQHGYSLTEPRQIVFGVLHEQAEAVSMAELVAACGGKLDRATVYRIISLFEAIGIVERLNIGWKYKLELTDSFNPHHHHLTCRQCGAVISLSEDQPLEERLTALAGFYHFQPESHQIEIRGLCQNCLKS